MRGCATCHCIRPLFGVDDECDRHKAPFTSHEPNRERRLMSICALRSWHESAESTAAINHQHRNQTKIKVIRSSTVAEGPRDASCQLKSCQLPRNSEETTCTTSPEQIEVMKFEGYSKTMCNKHVHSTMTRTSHFHRIIAELRLVTDRQTQTDTGLWLVPRMHSIARYKKRICSEVGLSLSSQ